MRGNLKNRHRLSILLTSTLLLLLYNNCTPGFDVISAEQSSLNSSTPGGNTPPPVNQNPPILQGLSCNAGEDPAPTPVKRLSKLQYMNSVRNVFNLSGGSEAFFGSEIFKEVFLNYALIPEDSKIIPGTGITTALTGFDRTDSTVGQYHIDGYFFVAVATANAFVNNIPRVQVEINAACGANTPLPPSAACIQNFIEKFGTRALKRPLSASEVQSYKETFAATAALDYRDGLAALVTRFLMAPQFIYMVETEGTPVNGRDDLFQLTGYELAARLSYGLVDDIPNAKLFKAAADGSILTDAGITAAVDNLMNGDDAARNYQSILRAAILGDGEAASNYQWNFTAGNVGIDNFFSQWLKLYAILPFEYSNKNLAALSDIEGQPTYLTAGPGLHHRHYADMMLEVENLYNHLTWTAKGSYRDLMTTDQLAYTSGDVKLVLGEEPWTGGSWKEMNSPMPSYPAGTRDGILTRAAFQISTNELTNPIKRGVFVQRQILCRQLPNPDPNALPDRALEIPESDPHVTTRDRFASKTSSASCMGCHSMINPAGFAFENFDSIGRIRSKEAIFNSSQQLVGQPTINSSATVPLNSIFSVNVTDGASLSRAIADSGAGDECFARQYFRYFYGRTETKGDGCSVKDLYETSTSMSMLDMFKRITQQPAFKLRKVGPQ